MQLALRRAPASDANWLDRLFGALIRWRLCTQYTHAGVVIDSRMYHANHRRGLFVSSFSPERWELFDVPGGGNPSRALELFRAGEGAGYDWWGVLGFIVPLFRGKRGYYCFSWCAAAMGLPQERYYTPETLLRDVIEEGAK